MIKAHHVMMTLVVLMMYWCYSRENNDCWFLMLPLVILISLLITFILEETFPKLIKTDMSNSDIPKEGYK